MFDVFFGWRKSSMCKQLLKQAQFRLKVLKKRRHSMVRQSSEILAQLIKNDEENIDFNRAKQLFKDESIEEAYELLDHFCEFILVQFSHIRKLEDCRDDVHEAVSSLIYASTRCGEVPELRVIRKLFEKRYGQKFAKAAIELFPGNRVNQQVIEKLSKWSVSDEMMHTMVNKIVKDYIPKPEILALEYSFACPEPVIESNENEIQSNSSQDLDITSTSTVSSTSQQTCLESYKEEKIEISAGEDSQITRAISSEPKEEKIVRASSSETMPKLNEDSIVYLDDIEEFRSSTTKDEDSPDSTLFRFKSSVQFEKDSFESSCEITSEEYGSSIKSEKLGLIKTQRACSLSRRKRTRRLAFHDIQIMDIGSIKYYGKQPYKKDFQHRRRKQGKKILVEESERRLDQFRGSERALTYSSRNHRCDQKRSSCSCCSNHKLDTSCSLESPRNFCPEDDVNDCRVMPLRKEKNVIGRDYCEDHLFWNESKGIEDKYSGLQGGQASHFRICKDSVSYLRAAVTMPPDRRKDNTKDDFHRSQSAKHVHPKLPDYDDIKAKFMALKKENQLSIAQMAICTS